MVNVKPNFDGSTEINVARAVASRIEASFFGIEIYAGKMISSSSSLERVLDMIDSEGKELHKFNFDMRWLISGPEFQQIQWYINRGIEELKSKTKTTYVLNHIAEVHHVS